MVPVFHTWQRLKLRQVGVRGGCLGALGWWPSSVKSTRMRQVWGSLVRAQPMVGDWPFWTGGTQYPTPTMEQFYNSRVPICMASRGMGLRSLVRKTTQKVSLMTPYLVPSCRGMQP